MLLECQGVAVAQRLAPFDAEVGQGELIHLLGPNGAGKSTLLACLAGLLPARGRLMLAGRPIGEWSPAMLARQRAWLSQQQALSGRMPVWHYLSMHQSHPPSLEERDRTLLALCQRFQLEQKLASPLSNLSGGEWQRVRLVAIFAQISQPEGRLLLLDEPMTGLDLAQQAVLDRYLAERVAAGLTAVVSGHDINHTLHHAQHVWLMKEGNMICQGEAKAVLQPDLLSQIYQLPFRRLKVENQEILTTFL